MRFRNEAGSVLRRTVLEIFVYENEKVVLFNSKHVLRNMDQIFAIVDPPPRSRFPCLRQAFFESLNISHLSHELLCRNSEAPSGDRSSVKKSTADFALICRNMALSAPIVDEGDMA